jgi:SSS family solute:Na+ symporter
MTVGRDFWWRLRGERENDNIPTFTRYGLLITTLAAWIVALAVPSVVKQWYAIGTVFVPGLLLPLLTAYYPRVAVGKLATVLSMTLAAGASAACLGIGWARHGVSWDTQNFPFHTQPMYVGLVVSALVYAVGYLFPASRPTAEGTPAG